MLICSFPDLVGGQIFCKAMPTRCPHAVTRTGRVRLSSLLITGLLVTPYLILSILATPTNAFLDDDDYTYTSEDKLSSGRFSKPLSIYCMFPNYLGSQKELFQNKDFFLSDHFCAYLSLKSSGVGLVYLLPLSNTTSFSHLSLSKKSIHHSHVSL